MPYISTTTSVKISDDAQKQLTKAFGEVMERVAGKSEEWLMLSFKDSVRMAFRGDCADSAILEVAYLGQFNDEVYDALTEELCSTASKILGVPSNRIYVKYAPTATWGYDGFNF